MADILNSQLRYPGKCWFQSCRPSSSHFETADRDKVPILTEDNPDDPGARLWSVYAHLSKDEDDDLTESWDKDMDVLLIYVS
jgi:hypothetical protein